MLDLIARLLEPLLRLRWPAAGRHRRPVEALPVAAPPAVAVALRRQTPGAAVPQGEGDGLLVRPYLLAHERSEEARRQRARRRALWLAVHGLDIGPRVIHGVEVAA
jgi:hypothetical protein